MEPAPIRVEAGVSAAVVGLSVGFQEEEEAAWEEEARGPFPMLAQVALAARGASAPSRAEGEALGVPRAERAAY